MTTAVAKKSSAAGRKRSSSAGRRRRSLIVRETEAKFSRARDVWALQQKLVAPSAGDVLLDAARKLLDEKSYKEVVEERALEGTCGFPGCDGMALGVNSCKKWSVNNKDREVYAQGEVGQFCCLECMRRSAEFAASLEGDPTYCRPASAVAAARSAVAAIDSPPPPARPIAADVPVHGNEDKSSTTSGSASKEMAHALEAAGASTGNVGSGEVPPDPGAASSALPKVRPRATVRFSRTNQTYNVKYEDFDGGGELPTSSSSSTATPTTARSAHGQGKAMVPTSSRGLTREMLMQKFISAPVIERIDAAKAAEAPSRTEVEAAGSATGARQDVQKAADPSTLDGSKNTVSFAAAGAGSLGDVATSSELTDLSEAEGVDDISSGDDFFDTNAVMEAPMKVSFVRVWGVLASWMTDMAKQVLHEAIDILPPDEAGGQPQPQPGEDAQQQQQEQQQSSSHEDTAAKSGGDSDDDFDDVQLKQQQLAGQRRAVLRQMLGPRLPPDMAFMAHRFDQLVSCLGVHQPLPLASELGLFDLLATLLVRALCEADVKRGVLERSCDMEARLDKQVAEMAKKLDIREDQIHALHSLFGEASDR
eukprot:TRINITY_DN1041_c5_g1_i1.p1 TRINITY_DN1041_c5_g1~~TRINITY_DN1041_c5_g1_i1.p1  ORF type:complete len:592 (-),score=177.95 TRINITY_DN1041_c5_g1_i1:119-1894(-)